MLRLLIAAGLAAFVSTNAQQQPADPNKSAEKCRVPHMALTTRNTGPLAMDTVTACIAAMPARPATVCSSFTSTGTVVRRPHVKRHGFDICSTSVPVKLGHQLRTLRQFFSLLKEMTGAQLDRGRGGRALNLRAGTFRGRPCK